MSLDTSKVANSNRATAATPAKPSKLGGVAGWADERLGLATMAKKNLRKVFPDHWSFMLGEIALWSFVVIILTGVYLTLFFHPSMNEVVYDGSYVPLQGMHMSEAFNSTMHISFDVRGGLLIRQIHHWAALIFLAGMFVHMMRVFFTGAFRKPREVNWLFGFLLFVLGMAASQQELTVAARNLMSSGPSAGTATSLVFAALLYLAITLPLTQLVAWMERKQKRSR